uniref:Uncharacterized protein n=1 Tax=Oryza meridionalis TaxID=40149 RepID=A0A0E0F9B7_9ORYZ
MASFLFSRGLFLPSPFPLRRGWAGKSLVCFHYKRLSDHLICIMNIFGILKPEKLKPVTECWGVLFGVGVPNTANAGPKPG